MSGPTADIKPGNALELRDIPVGSMVHNVEMKPGKGGQLVRSAGAGGSSDGEGRQVCNIAASIG